MEAVQILAVVLVQEIVEEVVELLVIINVHGIVEEVVENLAIITVPKTVVEVVVLLVVGVVKGVALLLAPTDALLIVLTPVKTVIIPLLIVFLI